LFALKNLTGIWVAFNAQENTPKKSEITALHKNLDYKKLILGHDFN
jgi:hypothetical protein